MQKKSDRGFTLLELLITVIIVGILAAIAAPNLIGLFTRYRVIDGFEQVKGAIKEAQRQAMRRGRRCKIRINETNGEINVKSADADGNYSGCLLKDRELPKGVKIKTNSSSPVITFSPKGNTNSAKTIVVYSADDNTKTKKCIAISIGLGLIRDGKYEGNASTSISADYCKKET